MQNAQNPISFRAIGIFPVTLDTLIWVSIHLYRSYFDDCKFLLKILEATLKILDNTTQFSYLNRTP